MNVDICIIIKTGILIKYSLNFLAIWSSRKIILSSSTKLILECFVTFSDRNGLTVFQNVLLSITILVSRLTGRDSANHAFQKTLQNFLQHLIHLSTETFLGNNSWKDLICYVVYHHLSCRDHFPWKEFISNTPKSELKKASSNFNHMYLLFQNSLFS